MVQRSTPGNSVKVLSDDEVAEIQARREIAESIAQQFHGRLKYPVPSVPQLVDAIEAALKARDERAAKIAETIPDTKFDLDHEPAPTEQQIRNGIAALIRGRK